VTPEKLAALKKTVDAQPEVPDDLNMEVRLGEKGEPLVKYAEARRVLKEANGALVLIKDADGRAFVGRIEMIEGDDKNTNMVIWARIEDYSETVQ